MRSSLLSTHPRLRRLLPWALWALAAAIGIPMALKQAGVGSSPAVIEARVASLAPMRTDHRLRVAKVFVTPGQTVKAGDLLIQMDTTEIDDDLSIAQAKLVYEEIMAGLRQVSLFDARVRTSHELAATAERAAFDVARVIAEAERDRSELRQLDENMALEEKLVGDKLASADRLKAMRLQRAALAKKVDEYRVAVSQARKSASGSNQRLGQWAKGNKNAKPATLPVQETPAGDARAAAADLHRREIVRLEYFKKSCEIRAPFAGRVGEILVMAGGLSADPGIPVVTVVEEVSSRAIAYVAQTSATKIRVGDTVRLVPRDLSGPALTGHVSAMAPNITEIPVRFRRVPTLQEFGRNAYIQLDTPATLPGQAFDAVFRHGPGSGT